MMLRMKSKGSIDSFKTPKMKSSSNTNLSAIKRKNWPNFAEIRIMKGDMGEIRHQTNTQKAHIKDNKEKIKMIGKC